MNSNLARRGRLALGGCLTALVAALFAIWFFSLLTPPRDISLLLSAKTPLPFPTQAPVVEPSPTPLPPTPPLLIRDSFLALGNFPRGPEHDYAQGGYVLSPSAGSAYLAVPVSTYQDPSPRDLSLDVEAAPLPSSGPVEYGVFFWHSLYRAKADRFICFVVNQDGYFSVRALVPFSANTADGFGYRWVDLVPSTRSVAITTTGLSNRLRVDVHPHQLFAFVNGTLVAHIDDPTLDTYHDRPDYDGQVGLLAVPDGKGEAQVKFTSFSLYVNSTK